MIGNLNWQLKTSRQKSVGTSKVLQQPAQVTNQVAVAFESQIYEPIF